jgi:hypothetical protein
MEIFQTQDPCLASLYVIKDKKKNSVYWEYKIEGYHKVDAF